MTSKTAKTRKTKTTSETSGTNKPAAGARSLQSEPRTRMKHAERGRPPDASERDIKCRQTIAWELFWSKLRGALPADLDENARKVEEGRRAGLLVDALIESEPGLSGRRKAWVARLATIKLVRAALEQYVTSGPGPSRWASTRAFEQGSSATAALLAALEDEVKWRADIEDPGTLQGLGVGLLQIWVVPSRVGSGANGGSPARRREVAKFAIEFGLDHEDIARLESLMTLANPELWGDPPLLSPMPYLFLAPAPRNAQADVLFWQARATAWERTFEAVRRALQASRGKKSR